MKKIIQLIIVFTFLALVCNAQILPKTNIVSTNTTVLNVTKSGQNFTLTPSGGNSLVSPNDSTYIRILNDSLNLFNYGELGETASLNLSQGQINLSVTNDISLNAWQTNFNCPTIFNNQMYINSSLGIDAFPTTTLNIAQGNATSINLGINTSTINITNDFLKSNGTTLNKIGTSTTNSLSIAATTVETVCNSTLVKKGTFKADDTFSMGLSAVKTNSTVVCTLRVYVNTTNSLIGATQIAYSLSSSANLYFILNRNNIFLSGGDMFIFSATQSAAFENSSNAANSTIPFNVNNDYYLITTVQGGAGINGTFGLLGFWIKP